MNLLKKLSLALVILHCSTAVISQVLLSPASITTSPLNTFFSSSEGRCIDGSGLSSIPGDVTAALSVVHNAPADEFDAAYSAAGSIETSWDFALGSPQNVKGIALWLPCAQHPHGDAPIKKIAVFNGTTTEIFELGAPSENVKFVNFSSTYVGATNIVIQVLETWYDLDPSSSCGESDWGVYDLSSSVDLFYNVTVGEVMLILDESCSFKLEIKNQEGGMSALQIVTNPCLSIEYMEIIQNGVVIESGPPQSFLLPNGLYTVCAVMRHCETGELCEDCQEICLGGNDTELEWDGKKRANEWKKNSSRSIIDVVPEEIKDEQPIITPNPSNGTFAISSLSTKASMTAIKVYDMSSKLVYSRNSIQNENRASVDLRNQESGIYIVKIIYSDGSVKQQKVVVEK